jgi:hypothetical protein
MGADYLLCAEEGRVMRWFVTSKGQLRLLPGCTTLGAMPSGHLFDCTSPFDQKPGA